MSRDYGTYPRFGLRRRTRIRPRAGCGMPILAAVVALLLLFLWVTRATMPMREFIPADPGYALYTTDLLATAQRVAGSRVWDVIPDDRPEYDWRYRLAGGLPLPEWVMRNLFHGLCHVSGNDAVGFSDPVVVTEITRVGNLLERVNVFVGAIERDRAGGLNLRHIPDAGIYYAVRGRTLLMSPSRDAIIGALTLHENAAVTEEALGAMGAALVDADFVLQARLDGVRLPAAADALSGIFETLSLSARFERDTLLCAVDARLRPEIQQRISSIAGEITPHQVPQPHGAIAALAWNLGAPLHEIWARYNSTRDEPILLAGLIGAEESGTAAPEGGPGAAEALAQAARLLGGAGRIMLRSVDQNEMLPTPELVGLFESNTAALREFMTALPPWLEGDGALTYAPFYDAETGTMRMPLVGGPAMELTAAVHGGEALLATSRPAALALMQEPPVHEAVGQAGNVYVTLQPGPLAREIAAAGAQFAEAGLLRGYTPESFAADAAKWQEIAAQVASFSALAGYEGGAVSMDLQLNVQAGG